MMRKLLTRWLAVGVLGLGIAAGSAGASTYAIGDLTALGSHSGASATFAAGASFSDSWTFTLSGGTNLFTGFFSSVFTPQSGFISPLTIVLSGPGGSMTSWSVVTSPGASGVQFSLYTASLPAGSYSLDIGGTAVRPASYSIDLTAAVPEPGHWQMLLAGLALIGGILRRRIR